MTEVTKVSSWLASIACGVFLVLAVLATPGVARADPPCSCCGPDPGPSDPVARNQWLQCMNYCMSHGQNCWGFWCESCKHPRCGAFPCLCRDPNTYCRRQPGTPSDCYCDYLLGTGPRQ
ncbi:unnamed protein product [Gemmataceae bacterium]|nr:unnamed protein product [Gemmataceae bacterium]VTT99373.1 unnamed protein product [Gemmataceae bacterium]